MLKKRKIVFFLNSHSLRRNRLIVVRAAKTKDNMPKTGCPTGYFVESQPAVNRTK